MTVTARIPRLSSSSKLLNSPFNLDVSHLQHLYVFFYFEHSFIQYSRKALKLAKKREISINSSFSSTIYPLTANKPEFSPHKPQSLHRGSC